MTFGTSIYRLGYELSPIILTNGIATNIPGGALPIIAITEALNFTVGLLSSGSVESLDDFFAHFSPLPGSTLVDNTIGTYPFANQAVAANSLIAQPTRISMLMTCPARNELGYFTKFATFLALEAALTQHNATAGTYTVITSTAIYTNAIMTGMRDISQGDTKQPQTGWQMDFICPLLTLEQAQSAQNSLMSKLSNGTQISGDPSWTGSGTTVGNPASIASPSVVPAGGNTVGTGVGALNPP